MIRQLSHSDLDPAADYLDSRTLVLRWLVAFVRGTPWESEGGEFAGMPASWSLWWDLRDSPGDPVGGDRRAADPVRREPVRGSLDAIRCVLAHFLVNRTLYVSGDPDADFEAIEDLCRELLLPARLVGDADVLDGWSARLPSIFASATRSRELDVLVYQGTGAVPAGFRLATPADANLLGEYLHLLYEELEEVGPPSVDALIGAEMVYVLEDGSQVKGMVIANPCDGRYVHASGVYVHPAYRGRGVGRRLAGGLGATVLREQGVPVLLDAFCDNGAALAAYRAAGYASRGAGRVVWLGEAAWEGAREAADPFALGGDLEDG